MSERDVVDMKRDEQLFMMFVESNDFKQLQLGSKEEV